MNQVELDYSYLTDEEAIFDTVLRMCGVGFPPYIIRAISVAKEKHSDLGNLTVTEFGKIKRDCAREYETFCQENSDNPIV